MDYSLLISELQSLVVESKRRYPDVKNAGDRALDLLKGPLAKESLSAHAEALLSPITLGCKTKAAKIIGISIAALQKLVSLRGVPTSSLSGVLQTLHSVSNQAVDIQLRILQTLLSILTFNLDIHDEVLGNALLLCFRLQESRVSVVSSTAAATLRQAVMLIFDRPASETSSPSLPLKLSTGGILVTPSAMDAFNIFSDLCVLTSRSGDKPKLLELNSLQRTFGLELIESIISGYEESVKQRPELLFLLSHSLDPLLLKLLAEKPSFPIALRVCRLIFLLVRSFTGQLPLQTELYLSALIRMGLGEEEKREPWLRVLALEILRGICGDGALLLVIFAQYDAKGSKVYSKLVTSLGKLVCEKPALLGVGGQMYGQAPSAEQGYLDMGIGMMASAASAGITTVGTMTGSTAGLGPHSALRLRLIEQHDKTEAPIIPETYIYLLALQSLNAMAECIYLSAGQEADKDRTKAMADSAWPALLAALSFCIGTNLSDSLFAEVLSALQDFTIACGMLSLVTPRDAFFRTLGKYAVPPSVVSAMQTYTDTPQTPRSSSVISIDAPVSSSPGLSERNLVCLKACISTARILAGDMGEAWYEVLELLQYANYMLVAKKPSMMRRPTVSSPAVIASSAPQHDRPHVFDDLDADSIHAAISILFDGVRDLNDEGFAIFISALCRLDLETVGTVSTSENDSQASHSPHDMIRRRTSGITLPQLKSGESYSLTKLRAVSLANLSRITSSDSEWSSITQHLLLLGRHPTAPTTIRMQASETLSEILLASVRIGRVSQQHQVFDILARQVDTDPVSNSVATDYDVRASGYQTLSQILESSGHALEVGWQTIFGILHTVIRGPELKRTNSQISIASKTRATFGKGDANLIRIAFPSLNLICTDFLSSLDKESMRECISCLGSFGRQKDDVNITLAAVGLLWALSDAVQQGQHVDLWLYLLTELLELGRDPRLEVRNSAMQTLFRCIELYGSTLTADLWENVLWKVIFPLLDAAANDESAVLALSSVGSIFATFHEPISGLPTSQAVYDRFLDRVKRAFASEPRQCVTAALKALEQVLASSPSAYALDASWLAFTNMSLESGTYTQDNLLALVRVASLLHEMATWDDTRSRQLSTILRAVMSYERSPEYRPDIDNMSPLQSAVFELLSTSTRMGASLVLSDLAEFGSLAYLGGEAGRTFVGLAKAVMPRMADVLKRLGDQGDIYEDGTIERVLGTYSIPIKLKYDCPTASIFGDDGPLWRTAMTNFHPVLGVVTAHMSQRPVGERANGIWVQIMDVFSGMLLADNASATEEDEAFVLLQLEAFKSAVNPRLADTTVPENIIVQYADILRKASKVYHYEVEFHGGTTAPAIPEPSEAMRYWAFDLLIHSVGREGDARDGRARMAKIVMIGLMRRIEEGLRQFLADAQLRGQMPLGRVRDDELLYILRRVVTLRSYPETSPLPDSPADILATAHRSSDRAHLFHLYPLLLELSFMRGPLPSMWIFPSEQAELYGVPPPEVNSDQSELDAGDGGDLIEVNARDLARRCLELIGKELGFS